MSQEEYLLGERDADQRHEYLNGELVAMWTGSRAHNLLATQSDMKVRVEAASRYYYPDVMGCCSPVEAEPDPYYETAPRLIVEILSPRTAANDDGEKRVNYQSLPSSGGMPAAGPGHWRGHPVPPRRCVLDPHPA